MGKKKRSKSCGEDGRPPRRRRLRYREPDHSLSKASRAVLARALFAAHTLIAVWRLYRGDPQWFYLSFAFIPIFLVFEGVITICQRDSDEYKWFCPCVCIFLLGSVPPIWLMEIGESWRVRHNQTDEDRRPTEAIRLSDTIQVELPWVPRRLWLQGVEQSLLIILVLGRWILPKGSISRDQLSQLLLAYIAISSDIVELFNVFNEKVVRHDMLLTLIVLGVWSLALVQYALVVTTISSKKVRPAFTADGSSLVQKPTTVKPNASAGDLSEESCLRLLPAPEARPLRWWERTDVWGIIMTIFLQDGPFFGLRVYLIFWRHVMSYTMLFFVAKNSLIISVQLYRLIVLCCLNTSDLDKRVGSTTNLSYGATNSRRHSTTILNEHRLSEMDEEQKFGIMSFPNEANFEGTMSPSPNIKRQ